SLERVRWRPAWTEGGLRGMRAGSGPQVQAVRMAIPEGGLRGMRAGSGPQVQAVRMAIPEGGLRGMRAGSGPQDQAVRMAIPEGGLRGMRAGSGPQSSRKVVRRPGPSVHLRALRGRLALQAPDQLLVGARPDDPVELG